MKQIEADPKIKARAPNPRLLWPGASRWAASRAWQVVTAASPPEMRDVDVQNTQQLNSTLEQNSVVGIAYHPSKKEAVLLPLFLMSHLPHLNKVFGPMAAEHYFETQGRAWALVAAAFFGSFAFPVVRKDHPGDAPWANHAVKFAKQLVRFSQASFAKKGSFYGVVPGATRSEELSAPETLNTAAAKFSDWADIRYVPVALFTDEHALQIRVGENFSFDQVGMQNATPLDKTILLMQRLAAILPQKFRGPY